MAQLLYRLGRFAARNPLRVLGFWILALAAAVTAFLTVGGTLASTFSIPGTQTAAVTAKLADKLPNLAGGTGTVVFRTADDKPFTAEQRKDISALLAGLKGHDHVRDVVDPFAVQQQIADQHKQLANGQKQVDDGKAQIAAGRQQLAAAQQQLNAAKAAAAGNPAAAAQLDQQQTQLDAQTKQLDASDAQIAAKSKPLEQGKQLLDFASKARTVSTDGTAATGAVMFSDDLYSLPQEAKDGVAHKLDAASIPGVQVDYSSEIAQSTNGLVGPGEVTGLIVAALVLLLMLRTLLATVLPLISSLVGVGVGVAGAMAFSGVVDMASVTPVLGLMLGLAVGIDYSLFIINRHRRQLRGGMDLHESIGLANGTAGGAVVFAGATVIVALLALNVTGIPFLGVMGDVAAVCVAIAVLVAITLPAALMRMVGTRLLTRRMRAAVGKDEHGEPAPRPMPTWRAVVTAVLAIGALLVIAAPALSMRLGLPDGSAQDTYSTAYRTFKTVADKFGTGVNGPLLITAQAPKPVAAADVLTAQVDIARELSQQRDVVAVAPAGVADSKDFFAFQVIPADGPTSQSTADLVTRLRALPALRGDITGGITLGVAGTASANIDVSDKLAGVLPEYLIVVVGLSLLIMIMVFRSLLVPLIATAGYVLSLFAAFGAVVAVYQWGWLSAVFGVHDPGPVLDFAPIILMGVLFGLAMDYQLFLVSGMREAYVHGVPARAAITAGLRNGRAVVTAAAIIMVSVFGGFVFSELTLVRPLGMGLAVGVLFDAFVVRMLLVPALMHLTGRAVWWLPRWLDRVLPNVDVEGAALERSHPLPGAEPVVEAERETVSS
ncbi:MMPL family transporter [Kutzneria buriramensis]|uniref:RND superfamily putative drug exporter n=1 Tax=Kutzneria buriramensis TaxID=1045776 RepID=A0A3E0HHZ9_9PSEU|nr:MMPL family transporter [Kutzneria buriramensis]REH46038.1 RND superfamily putative drug exporter [Kutzneria buriramensis]